MRGISEKGKSVTLIYRVVPGTTERMTPQYTPYTKATPPQDALLFIFFYHVLRTGWFISAGRMQKGRDNTLISPNQADNDKFHIVFRFLSMEFLSKNILIFLAKM